jgi:hypothetical protein
LADLADDPELTAYLQVCSAIKQGIAHDMNAAATCAPLRSRTRLDGMFEARSQVDSISTEPA